MPSPNDEAIPAEGSNRHACDMTRTTGEAPDEKVSEPDFCHRHHYAESPVGPILVTASVKVLHLALSLTGQWVPFVRMELTVAAEDTKAQPKWSVVYEHYTDMIMDSLGDYLREYCPAPTEVMGTLVSGTHACP